MGIKKKTNKWILFFISLFVVNIFSSYEVQAENNSNTDESKVVDEVELTKNDDELYMGKEDVDRLLEESSQQFQLKLLEYKLETQTEKNSILQGNISTILSLVGIIIAIIVALFGGLWKWFEYTIKTGIGKSLQEVKDLKAAIDGINNDINHRHTDINESYKKIRALEDELHTSNVNYKKFLVDKSTLEETSNNILQYAKYLEIRCKEMEWACKFLSQRELRNKKVNELKHLIDTELKSNEQVAIAKFTKKHGNNITDDDSKLSNIYDYYLKCLKEEEEELLNAIDIFWGYMDYQTYYGDDEEYGSDIESKYEDWNGYMSDLEDMLEIVEAVIAMNAVRS